jgi:hypothetical protein
MEHIDDRKSSEAELHAQDVKSLPDPISAETLPSGTNEQSEGLEEDERVGSPHPSVEHDHLKRTRAWLAAFFAATSIGTSEPPTIPDMPLSVDETKDLVESDPHADVSETRLTSSDWHEKVGTAAHIDVLHRFMDQRILGNTGSAEHVTPQAAIDALTQLHRDIAQYPKELRDSSEIDQQLLLALFMIQEIVNHDPFEGTVSSPVSDADRIAVTYVRERALPITYNITDEMMPQYLRLLRDRLSEDAINEPHLSAGTLTIAYVMRNHIKVAAQLAELFKNESPLTMVAEDADALYAQVKDAILGEGNGTTVSRQMLRFFVEAGVSGAQEEFAQRVLDGRVLLTSVEEEHSIPDDVSMARRGFIPSTARAAAVGHGAYAITRHALSEWGLANSGLLEDWGTRTSYGDTFGENLPVVQELELAERGGTKELLEKYGIRFPGRYPAELLKDQLASKEDRTTPYGVMITGHSDYNGVFYQMPDVKRVYEDAKAQGMLLRVVEAGSSTDATGRLLQLRDNADSPFAFLGVRGHGEVRSVQMGEGEDGLIDHRFLGVGPDRTSLLLKDRAPIYFASCSTGAKGGIAEQLSRETNGEVVAPDLPTQVKDIHLTKAEDGTLTFDVSYAHDKGNVVNANRFRNAVILQSSR